MNEACNVELLSGNRLRTQGYPDATPDVDIPDREHTGIPGKPVTPVASPANPTRRRARTVQTGFVPSNDAVHRVYNLALALLLVVPALPLMSVISVALLVTQGPRILYRGERLGKDGKPFNIFKFRTLHGNAAMKLTRDKVLPKDSGIETPLGRYLRSSRLDELPQLFNIILGDMNICGPRPVRQNIAAIECARNPLYNMRFRVKPGLVGHSQAYMSHGASKRLRAKYNYMLCASPVVYRYEMGLFLRVGLSVCNSAMRGLVRRLMPEDAVKAARRRAERWQLTVVNHNTGRDEPVLECFRDLLVMPKRSPTSFSGRKAVLRIRMNPAGARYARLTLEEIGPVDGGYAFRYAPSTPAARYLIDRYLFEDAVVRPRSRPRRSRLLGRPSLQGPSVASHMPAE